MFETIQVLNQKKIPSEFDRLSDEEDPRNRLPVPLQSLIPEQQHPPQPLLHFAPPLTVTTSSDKSDGGDDDEDDDVYKNNAPPPPPPILAEKDYSEHLALVSLHANSPPVLAKRSILDDDGIEDVDEDDEVQEFDVDSFTNQLLERCEVLLQDYRARKDPASNDITIKKLHTEEKHTLKHTPPPPSSSSGVSQTHSKNSVAVEVQTSRRAEAAAAMDVGIQTISRPKRDHSSTSTNSSTIRLDLSTSGSRHGDVSGVRVDHSSSTLGNISEGSGLLYLSSSSGEEDSSDEGEEAAEGGGEKYREHEEQAPAKDKLTQQPTSSQSISRLPPEALDSDASNMGPDLHPTPVQPGPTEKKTIENIKATESLHSQPSTSNNADHFSDGNRDVVSGGPHEDAHTNGVVVNLEYVQPYLDDKHVQELWRRLSEVDAALRLLGVVDNDSGSTTRWRSAAANSHKAPHIHRYY